MFTLAFIFLTVSVSSSVFSQWYEPYMVQSDQCWWYNLFKQYPVAGNEAYCRWGTGLQSCWDIATGPIPAELTWLGVPIHANIREIWGGQGWTSASLHTTGCQEPLDDCGPQESGCYCPRVFRQFSDDNYDGYETNRVDPCADGEWLFWEYDEDGCPCDPDGFCRKESFSCYCMRSTTCANSPLYYWDENAEEALNSQNDDLKTQNEALRSVLAELSAK